MLSFTRIRKSKGTADITDSKATDEAAQSDAATSAISRSELRRKELQRMRAQCKLIKFRTSSECTTKRNLCSHDMMWIGSV